jgi:hypothetical protein
METASPPEPHFAAAATLLDALTAHDFAHLAAAFDRDATLRALLPGGFREWRGAVEIGEVFEHWFGDVDEFDVADITVGDVGPLLSLRWRLRLRGPRFGDAARVVEQHAYAVTAPTGQIGQMSLLCSGFWREHHDAGPSHRPATA